MNLRQAAFRAAAATMIVVAGTVSGVSGAPAVRAATPTRIAVIGDSYTAGSNEGGNGPRSWTEQAWKMLARRGVDIEADVAAEGGAGYGQPGNRGSVFQDLTARAVRRNDVLVVFFGSRNDQPVNPAAFPDMAAGTLHLARFAAPDARFLVIGPPWPTATPPPAVLTIRNSLRVQAAGIGATFIDPIAANWFVGRPDLIGHDGVHPTDAGHVYLAEKIAPLIYNQLTTRI
jgi:lysophospholipase L1-like esterase